MADRKPDPQPIVRGPVVQGQGQTSRERHESADAGRAGARTVEGPGAEGPGRERPDLTPPDDPNTDTPNTDTPPKRP